MSLSRSALRAYVTLPLCLMFLAGLDPAPATSATARLEQLPADWLDDGGQDFHLGSLRGHLLVLTMAYASCHRVCPLTMERLQRLQRDYDSSGIDAQFVIVGYDPEADDPATWKQY